MSPQEKSMAAKAIEQKSGQHLLEVNNLHVDFSTYSGTVHAVRGVNFHVDRGETLAIVGESGSGKSVTARTVMGILSKNAIVSEGEVLYNGTNILNFSEEEMCKIRGEEIGMIFQDPMSSLDPVQRVGRQISEAPRVRGKMSNADAKDLSIKLMDQVGIKNTEERYRQYPFQFSGGMRQRIVIATALACNPELLICDEPTTALDVTVQAKIIDLIKEIQRVRNIGVIFITHDLGVVANVSDRVAVMYAGRIVEYGTVEEIFSNPRHPYTMALMAAMPDLNTDSSYELYTIPGAPPNMLNPPKGDAFAPRNRYAMEIDQKYQPPFFKLSDTHYAATWLLHEKAPHVVLDTYKNKIKSRAKEGVEHRKFLKTDDVLISIKNLKQYFTSGYGGNRMTVKAVDNVSFDIHKGETFGLVGESGCGKTTTGRTIIRLYEPTSGSISFNGKDITGKLTREEKRDINSKMSMIFQDPIASLNPRMTVKEIIAEGLKINHLCKDDQEIDEKVYKMLSIVGLTREHATRYPHEFSGGQRQRIGVARALITNPEFVIADEPVSALDVSIQAQVLNLLNSLKKDMNLTMLFIAHDLSVVKYVSDRIGVMYFGKLVEVGYSEEVYQNPLHPYTKSLLSAIPIPDPAIEKQRKHLHYDPKMHQYGNVEPTMREVTPHHYVLCSDQEEAQYIKESKEKGFL